MWRGEGEGEIQHEKEREKVRYGMRKRERVQCIVSYPGKEERRYREGKDTKNELQVNGYVRIQYTSAAE